MSFIKSVYEYPLDFQEEAEAWATNGLCGDISHQGDVKITDCMAQKEVLIFSAGASYSVVHFMDDYPVELHAAMKVSRIVLPATKSSKGTLGQLIEILTEPEDWPEHQLWMQAQIAKEKEERERRQEALQATRTTQTTQTNHPGKSVAVKSKTKRPAVKYHPVQVKVFDGNAPKLQPKKPLVQRSVGFRAAVATGSGGRNRRRHPAEINTKIAHNTHQPTPASTYHTVISNNTRSATGQYPTVGERKQAMPERKGAASECALAEEKEWEVLGDSDVDEDFVEITKEMLPS